MTKAEFGPTYQEEDKPIEDCAVFGMVSFSNRDVAPFAKLALHATQNRGEDGSGIAVLDSYSRMFRAHKDLGLVAQIYPEDLSKINIVGSLAIGHNRYATSGTKNMPPEEKKRFLQPYIVAYNGRSIALAHNGNIPEKYIQELRKELPEGIPFQSDTDSEVLAWRIMHAEGKSWREKIKNGLSGVKGAYSLVIATDTGDLFGIKDPQGIRPLVIAKTGDGFAFVSETRGLEYFGKEIRERREVGPGEMIHIMPSGEAASFQLFPKGNTARCLIEPIYFKHPFSQEGSREVRDIRKRMGENLAAEFKFPEDYIVVGVPDSGLEIADGYARAVEKYPENLIKKDRYRPGRTFIADSDGLRDEMLELKFTISDDVFGKKLIIIDDSVIRGKTTRKLIASLKERGALEVHVLSGSPPFINTCDLGVDIATLEELQALKRNGGNDFILKSNEEIAQEIGADSIGYLSLDGLISAIGGKKSDFCTNCLNRVHPIESLGVRADKLYKTSDILQIS